MIYIRIIVSIFLLVGVYSETGGFTVLCFALCLAGIEVLVRSCKKIENKP